MAGVASQAGEADSSRAPGLNLWFAGVRECPPWCSIVGATVTVHQFFCILHFILLNMGYFCWLWHIRFFGNFTINYMCIWFFPLVFVIFNSKNNYFKDICWLCDGGNSVTTKGRKNRQSYILHVVLRLVDKCKSCKFHKVHCQNVCHVAMVRLKTWYSCQSSPKVFFFRSESYSNKPNA